MHVPSRLLTPAFAAGGKAAFVVLCKTQTGLAKILSQPRRLAGRPDNEDGRLGQEHGLWMASWDVLLAL